MPLEAQSLVCRGDVIRETGIILASKVLFLQNPSKLYVVCSQIPLADVVTAPLFKSEWRKTILLQLGPTGVAWVKIALSYNTIQILEALKHAI